MTSSTPPPLRSSLLVVKRVLIVAGEASGDLHGAALARKLKHLRSHLHLEGMGGEQMQEAGVALACHAASVSVVGVWEVAKQFRAVAKAFLTLRRILLKTPPDLLILIDYPDFNLLLARIAGRVKVPVLYFIGPQVWAWRRGRLRTIRRFIKKALLIFPFEEKLYREAGIDATFIGHPLLDRLRDVPSQEEAARVLELDGKGPLIGLLPGSRLEELRRHLPVMLQAAERIRTSLPEVRFALALADPLPFEEAEAIIKTGGWQVVRRGWRKDELSVMVVKGRAYEVMRASDLLIVASGTATVEAALLETPMIIIYRLSPLSFLLGRLLIQVPFIGMANLVAGKRIVPELIQHEASPSRIASLALELLASPERLQRIRAELGEVKARLGDPGAIERAAHEVLKLLGE